jgi:hypothetical protein
MLVSLAFSDDNLPVETACALSLEVKDVRSWI